MVGQFMVRGEILGRRLKRAHPNEAAKMNGWHSVRKHKRAKGRDGWAEGLSNEELTRKVALFFEGKKDIVSKVFKIDPGLIFYVELKQITDENESNVTEFVRDYQYYNDWESRPLFFQIVPPELVGKMNVYEKVYGYGE